MKRIFQVMSLVLAAVLLFAACRSDEETAVSSPSDLIELTQNQNYATFQIMSNTSWTLKCYTVEDGQLVEDPDNLWFMVNPTSGLGSHVAKLNVLSYNDDVDAREGAIVITSDDGKVQTIRITQAPAASIECYLVEDTLLIPASGATDVLFTVVATAANANVEAYPEGGNAMYESKSLDTISEEKRGNTLRKTFTISIRPNITGAERALTVKISVTFGEYYKELALTIKQSGSYGAEIVTQPAVYLQGTTPVTQAVWIEGAKMNESVQFDEVEIPSSVDWLSAEINSGILSVRAFSNCSTDTISEAVITLRATVGSENVATNVRVVHPATSAKSIFLVAPYVMFDYMAQGAFAPYTLKNAAVSDLHVFSGYSWIKNIKLTSNGVYFNLEEFTGGSKRYREGSIFITVGDVVAQILVRQYEKSAVGRVDVPTIVTLSQDVTSCTIPLNLTGELNVVANTNVTANVNSSELEVATAAVGDGVVTFSYTHNGAVDYFNTVVRRYSAVSPFEEYPQTLSFHRAGTTKNISLEQTGVKVIASPNWANASVVDKILSINVAELTESTPRTGLIVLSYGGENYVMLVNQTYTEPDPE